MASHAASCTNDRLHSLRREKRKNTLPVAISACATSIRYKQENGSGGASGGSDTWTPFNVKMAEIFHNFRNIFPKISPVDETRDVGHFCFCVRKDLTKRSAANWRQAITAARAISCHLDDLTGILRSNASSHRFEPKRLLIELHRSYRTASKIQLYVEAIKR